MRISTDFIYIPVILGFQSQSGEPADGLQRDLGGELWRAADLEELVLLAELAELREVAAGLAHHPHGRALHELAPGSPQDEVVLQGGELYGL